MVSLINSMATKIVISLFTLGLITGTLYLSLIPLVTTIASQPESTSEGATESTAEIRIAEINALAASNPTQAIAALKEFIKIEPSFMNQCHELAHKIGHVVYENFGETAFTYKDPFCGAGYLHGLLEAATIFNESSSLKEIVHTVCSGEIEEACLHGLGHAIYKSVHDIPTAIAYCDKIRTKNNDCYDGIYMELFDTETDSAKMPPPEAVGLCADAPSYAKPSCVFYLPRVLKDASPEKMLTFCTTLASQTDRNICAEGSGVARMKYATSFVLETITNECTYYADETLEKACVKGAQNYFTYGNITNNEW